MDKSPDGSVKSRIVPQTLLAALPSLNFFSFRGGFFMLTIKKQRFDAQVRPKGEKILAGQKNKEEKIL